ncbi:transglutaminase domain-containing protein [Desulfobotulus sp. H1]|uniref:Transglutaminase domain-containing protein n=1 Tax=Desulfobotulus pelophilus TaxID=2823377 RepID=A0ABT3NBR4_9BACT|nr:transglutaminase domain-containing protein [Desulfobotulus pelophilus]MCW7754910.1 transglutaminase domain-containing protein [Desulfobotulus pelophilus]
MSFLTKKSLLCAALGSLILLFLIAGERIHRPGHEKEDVSTGVSEQRARTIHLAYVLSLRNISNEVISHGELHVLSPLSATSFQSRVGLRADHPYEMRSDPPAENVMVFRWEEIPPFATRIFRIRTAVELREEPLEFMGTDLDSYLAPEPFMESDHEEIRALAASLESVSSLQTIENFFSWVSEHIVYTGYAGKTGGALFALEQRRGDCTEFASLFVALCRAIGIPSRMMGGFMVSDSQALDLGNYHNWAEFFYEGQWRVADPQQKRFMEREDNYIAFHVSRPSEIQERSLVLQLEGTGLRVGLNR